MSVRLELTLSYAGFLMVAGALMLAAAWLAGRPGQSLEFLLRYIPDGVVSTVGGLVPGTTPSSCARSLRPRRSCWRSCWSSVSSEGGFSPVGCSPR